MHTVECSIEMYKNPQGRDEVGKNEKEIKRLGEKKKMRMPKKKIVNTEIHTNMTVCILTALYLLIPTLLIFNYSNLHYTHCFKEFYRKSRT